LHPAAQRVEQGCYGQGGSYDSEGGTLARNRAENGLQTYDAPEVERDKRGREGTVDEGAVYENV